MQKNEKYDDDDNNNNKDDNNNNKDNNDNKGNSALGHDRIQFQNGTHRQTDTNS